MKAPLDRCPRCEAEFEPGRNKKTDAPDYSLPIFRGERAFSRYIDFFMVICPRCRNEFPSEHLKMFGFMGAYVAWVPVALLLLFFVLLGAGVI